MPEPNTPEAPNPSRDTKLVSALKYTHIAFALPGGVIAGWLLGALADRWLGTTYLYLVGLGLGIIAGFYDLTRTMMRMNKDADGSRS